MIGSLGNNTTVVTEQFRHFTRTTMRFVETRPVVFHISRESDLQSDLIPCSILLKFFI